MLMPFGNPMLKLPSLRINGQEFKKKDAAKGKISTVTASFILFCVVMLTFASVWNAFSDELASGDRESIQQFLNFSFASGVLAFSLAFISYYKPTLSPYTAPFYAVFSAVFIAGLSLSAEFRFPGIALLTWVITATVFLLMLSGYKLGIIKASKKYRAGVYAATASIALIYMVSIVLTIFGFKIPMIHDAGIGSILWSGFIATIAALNLVVDFDNISRIDRDIPAYMHWRLALGLTVTLIWLYFSILRLLVKIKRS